MRELDLMPIHRGNMMNFGAFRTGLLANPDWFIQHYFAA
jgi:hypothetical protein